MALLFPWYIMIQKLKYHPSFVSHFISTIITATKCRRNRGRRFLKTVVCATSSTVSSIFSRYIVFAWLEPKVRCIQVICAIPSFNFCNILTLTRKLVDSTCTAKHLSGGTFVLLFYVFMFVLIEKVFLFMRTVLKSNFL